MKKVFKFLGVVTIGLLLFTFSSCSGRKDIVGHWYNSSGEVEYDVREDGTYDDGGYGTGVWKYLDDGETIEFTDFYGYTETTKIIEDDFGYSIFNGRYYKDKYPSAEEISEYKEKNAVLLDAFNGVEYEVSGISPYCQISINNQGCSEEVQKYVTFSLDKTYYANGETAVVTAYVSSNTGGVSYKLDSTEESYEISGQSEYVTLTQAFDDEFLENEVNDVVTSLISSAIGTNSLCNVSDIHILDYETRLRDANFYSRNGITEVKSNYKATYFSCIKEQKENAVNVNLPYNRCSYVYCFDVYGDVNGTICEGKLYVNITAENIVCQPDGTIFWDNENCNFDISTGTDGFDNCVSNTIMSNSNNYNISKVEK